MAQSITATPTNPTSNTAAGAASGSGGAVVVPHYLQSPIDIAWLRVNTTPIKQVRMGE